jgi:hypothetical protein
VEKTSRVWLWVLGVIIVVAVVWAVWSYNATLNTSSTDRTAITQLLIDFGDQMQSVSLLTPDASSTIASAYSQYVDPSLLSRWEADPASAPGRETSSPWPDHIEITDITQSASSYVVNGDIVLMTSIGEAGREHFIATVARENNQWYIADFTLESTTPTANASTKTLIPQ